MVKRCCLGPGVRIGSGGNRVLVPLNMRLGPLYNSGTTAMHLYSDSAMSEAASLRSVTLARRCMCLQPSVLLLGGVGGDAMQAAGSFVSRMQSPHECDGKQSEIILN